MRAQRINITRHARDRAVQRLGVPNIRAASHLKQLFQGSVKLPRRYGRQLIGLPVIRGSRKAHTTCYRVYGDVLLICRGRTLITLWRLQQEQQATVCLWLLLGQWLRGGECVRPTKRTRSPRRQLPRRRRGRARKRTF